MKSIIQFFLCVVIFCTTFILNAQEQKAGSDAENRDTLSSEIKKDEKIIRRFLVLEKNGANKRMRFYEGQELEFKLHGDIIRNKTRIQKIEEKSLIIQDVNIPLEDFASVRINTSSYYPNLFKFATLVGGAGYLGLDVINNGPEMTRQSFITPAIFLGTHLLLRIFYPNRKTYKLGKNKYLKTIIIF